jgi:hypothetical protein
MDQVVEHLPTKPEVMSAKPNIVPQTNKQAERRKNLFSCLLLAGLLTLHVDPEISKEKRAFGSSQQEKLLRIHRITFRPLE